jgi:hypothetical protein
MELRRSWRLVICGELRIEHHRSPMSRACDVERMFQCGFGAGRIFAKNAQGFVDYLTVAHYVIGELIVDLAAFAAHPSRKRLQLAFSRTRGIFAGICSIPRRPFIGRGTGHGRAH